jgi:hypothetical protein
LEYPFAMMCSAIAEGAIESDLRPKGNPPVANPIHIT